MIINGNKVEDREILEVLDMSYPTLALRRKNESFKYSEIEKLSEKYGVTAEEMKNHLYEDKAKVRTLINDEYVPNSVIADHIDKTVNGVRLKRINRTFSYDEILKLSEIYEVTIEEMANALYNETTTEEDEK